MLARLNKIKRCLKALIKPTVVNGTDSFPHEDAVRTFLTAQDPIVVEAKRKIAESPVGTNKSSSSKTSSIACQPDESEYAWLEEEVTLRKRSSDEKLGLALCYSSGLEADTCTEVYIRDIVPQSVADRDGRLQQGDQILQVNGKDVGNKEKTESLFAENRKAVTLLVSRCYTRSEEYLDAISHGGRSAVYQNNIIDQLIRQQFQQRDLMRSEPAPKIPAHFNHNLTNSQVRSKRKLPQLPYIPAPLVSDTEHVYEAIPESDDPVLEPIYSYPYEAGNENMIEQWLTAHQKDEQWNAKENNKQRSKSSTKNKEHENSSSAYNTGGFCNSNPLTFELACSQDYKQKDIYRSTLIVCPPEKEDPIKDQAECGACKRHTTKTTTKKSKSNGKIASTSSPTTRSGVSHIFPDTMYTNAANLQQTMLLQQQLFRQALAQQGNEVAAKPTTSFTSPSLSQYQFASGSQSYTTQAESATLESCMEWKVKIRPDGTRYIARRPVRNRILKNRAIRISEERAGLTTDDDTISELKIGRYWNKEERKKHLEKSKERKQRQEILLASRPVDENDMVLKPIEKTHSFSSKKAANNIDNTAKKHKTKMVHMEGYDNFATVQDILVHGSKIPNKVGLLSVTTV